MRKLIVKTRESNAYTAGGEVCLPAYFAAFCAQERDKIVLSFAMSCA